MSDIETRGTIENHYEGEKRAIIDAITEQGALSPELRAALTKAVEEVFSHKTAETTARPQITAVEAKDSGAELKERLMAELVDVWNKTPEADRYLEARIQELEQKGWFVSKQRTPLLFAKHPNHEEGFYLPSMPGWAKDTALKYFTAINRTPNQSGELVVSRLVRPYVLDADKTQHLLHRIDWDDRDDVDRYLFLIGQNAEGVVTEKGVIEVKVN